MGEVNLQLKAMFGNLAQEAITRLEKDHVRRVWGWLASETSTFARQTRSEVLTTVTAKLTLSAALADSCIGTLVEDSLRDALRNPEGREFEIGELNRLVLLKYVDDTDFQRFFDQDGVLDTRRLLEGLSELPLVVETQQERASLVSEMVSRVVKAHREASAEINPVLRDMLDEILKAEDLDGLSLSQWTDQAIFKLHKLATGWPTNG